MTISAPGDIEATIEGEALLIGQACVIGEGRPFNVALLTLEPSASRAFVEHAGLTTSRPAQHRLVAEAVRAEVMAANARLPEAERIKRFLLLDLELKLEREPIASQYAKEIQALYEGEVGMRV